MIETVQLALYIAGYVLLMSFLIGLGIDSVWKRYVIVWNKTFGRVDYFRYKGKS